MNFYSIFQFLPFPVKHSTVTKCCKTRYNRLISFANTTWRSMQTSGILILASLNKHLISSRTWSEDSFSCFFMFLIIRQRRRLYCSFSSQYFSRSCRSIFIIFWRFEFSCFRFVTCCCSIDTIELISSNWFLYFCIVYQNSDWIKTFIFLMSSLIIEDLNSFNFLSIIVLKSTLLTSLLSSWKLTIEHRQNEVNQKELPKKLNKEHPQNEELKLPQLKKHFTKRKKCQGRIHLIYCPIIYGLHPNYVCLYCVEYKTTRKHFILNNFISRSI